MKLVDELLEELTEIATNYNKDEITKDEANILIELIKPRIESLEVNYRVRPLSYLTEKGNNKLIDALLNKAVYKAITALSMLQGSLDNKRTFNAKMRYALASRLYFNGIECTLKRSVSANSGKNNFKNKNHHLQLIIRQGDYCK